MKEFKAIISAYLKIDWAQRQAALATVVRVKGSSYRSPGARMLITDDGTWVGSISGGCLEGDALRKARQVMHHKTPMTVTYDTREESNQNLGIGLGCNGVIDVLIEPLDPNDEYNAVRQLEKYINIQEPISLATIFRGEGTGEKIVLSKNNYQSDKFKNASLHALVVEDATKLILSGKSQATSYIINEESIEVFIELIEPGTSLIIFGGGFDARPVSQLAKSLGWHVVVTDECVAHIAPIFFPDADKISLCHRDFIDRDFNITPYTACVLMSHNYNYDRDVLRKIIFTSTPYIGILGPRKRYDKMLDELKQDGLLVTGDHEQRIHSPIGLDIGAETPDEIALSIIAEVQGKFARRSGGFLKYRQGPIHQRDSANDQVFKQIYLHAADAFSSASSTK
jgi:xanthine dehydrogenase accessory factor